jgi:excisionase family DNA binding protein
MANIKEEVLIMLRRTEQAAEKLTVKKSTMEAWRCRGGGPPFVRYGRAIRYRDEDLDRFIESHLRRNTSDRIDPEAMADR